jgi:K+-transporting ATPase ATPase C chain
MAPESPSSSVAGAELEDLKNQLRPAALSVLLLTVLTGALFPLVVTLVAGAIFPRQAAGSLIVKGGRVVGSELVGQDFRASGYFHPRPSAAGSGYDAVSSGGSNLGPLNPKLTEGANGYDGIVQLAAAYRRENGLAPELPLPADAVTRSGSGLDPHISPGNAALQAARVARARGLPLEEVSGLIAVHTEPRQWLFLGEPRVNVLALNLALDRVARPPAGSNP